MLSTKLKSNSLRFRIFAVIFAIWVLLFITISFYANFTRKLLISEIQTTNQNMLNLYADQLNTLCTDVNRCLAEKTINTNFSPDSLDLGSLTQELEKDILLYNNKFSFYYSDPASQNYIFQTASNITLKERQSFSRYFYDLNDTAASSSWQIIQRDSLAFLTCYYNVNNQYLGAWISLSNALQLYAGNNFAEQSTLFFTDSNTDILTYISQDQDSFSPDDLLNSKTNLVLSVGIASVPDLYLTLSIPYSTIFAKLNMIRIVEVFLLLFIVLCIPILLYYLTQMILRPMQVLTGAMEKVQDGNLSVTIDLPDSAEEFQNVSQTFNTMVSEIRHLKIDNYEQKIFNQQLELEKLQQQVKPHFYLNCLNIIYNLAEGAEYELIQELCMAQAKYFRYMLKSSFSTVALEDEIAHIKNYLHIQQLRYPGRFFIDFSLHTELKNIQIPPLVLHVFAENVVKHAASSGPIQFSISATLLDEKYIQIQIADTGPGFPSDVLDMLCHPEALSSDSGDHIGISNTIKRLRIFYKGQARISFENQRPHGALITLLIPKGEFK